MVRNTLHALFEQQAKQSPGKVALEFENTKLTYRALNQKANQLAHFLLSSYQIKPDTLIPIMVDRGLDAIIGILAILKTGGAYVPIHPENPASRIEFILKDTDAPIFLTQSNFITEKKLTLNHIKNRDTIFLDKMENEIQNQSTDDIESSVHENNLAYVIYTSGSTGQPKGVLIQHDNVINFLFAIQPHLLLTHTDSFLVLTAFSFDISVLEIFLPLIVGARCIIASSEIAVDPRKIGKFSREKNISVVQATPALWHLLLNESWNFKKSIKILCGGEALSPSLAQKLLTKVNRFWNVYGPTETTIWSTIFEVKQNDIPTTIPIGKPLSNTI